MKQIKTNRIKQKLDEKTYFTYQVKVMISYVKHGHSELEFVNKLAELFNNHHKQGEIK